MLLSAESIEEMLPELIPIGPPGAEWVSADFVVTALGRAGAKYDNLRADILAAKLAHEQSCVSRTAQWELIED